MLLKKNKLTGLIIVLACLFIIVGCSNESNKDESGDPQVIKVAATTPEDTSLVQGLFKFKEIVEDRTDGDVEIDIYPNLQLGSLREQAEAAQIGNIQMSLSPISTLSSFTNELELFEYPYILPSNEDKLWELMDGNAGDKAMEKLGEDGFEGLGFWGVGYKAITTNDAPVLKPDDLKNKKIRVIPSDALIAQYEAWGANPVPIEYAELYSALQQGTVEGQENPLETIYTTKYQEVQEYLSITNHGYMLMSLVANKDWFDGLSSDLQEIIVEAEIEAREYERKLTKENNEEYLTKLEEDLKVSELTDEQMDAFIDLSEPLYEDLADTEGKKEILNIIQNELENN